VNRSSEYERAKIMERSRRGKRHAARRGSVNVLVSAPYGYRYIDKHAGGGQAQYQVVPEQARIVKQVFEWVGLERTSMREVQRRLRTQQTPSAKGGSWPPSTIRNLLRNPAYKGTAIFGRHRVGERRAPPLRPAKGKPEHAKRSSPRYATDPKDQIEIAVPAIVSAELFQAVADQLAENHKRARQQAKSPGYLLQGLIECGCCGYTWYGKGITRFTKNDQAPYPYYRCIGMDTFRFGGSKPCSYRPVRLDRLDAVVWNDVRALLQNPQDLYQEFERRLGTDPEPDFNLEQIRKQITTAQRSISRLIDAYESDLLEKSEFEPRIAKARERLQRLEQESTTATEQHTQRAELRLVLSHLEDFATQVRDGLEKADFATRKEIIRSLIKVIKIEEQNVRIIYRITPRPFDQGPSRGQIRQHCSDRVQSLGWGRSAGAGPVPLGRHRFDHRLRGHRLARFAERVAPVESTGYRGDSLQVMTARRCECARVRASPLQLVNGVMDHPTDVAMSLDRGHFRALRARR
jgi:site-specific DNA recombinase